MGIVRFLLALCVVGAHSPGSKILGITLFSGITAVQCFYVISGFLITMVLNEKAEYKNTWNFYLSRYLRLWPIYVLVAVLTLIFYQWSLPSLLLQKANRPTSIFIIISNLIIFFQDWILFLRFNEGGLAMSQNAAAINDLHPYDFLLVPQAWTLGVELTFYAVAPFVCRKWWAATSLLIFGTCVRYVLARHYLVSLNSGFLYRFSPAEMMLFGGGAISYFIGRVGCTRYPHVTKAACFFLIPLFAYMTFTDYRSVTNDSLLLANYPVLLFMTIAAPFLFYGTRTNRLDTFLGELSYPMYISHVLVYVAIIHHLPASAQIGNIAYVVSVLVFSAMLAVLVAKPIDRMRHRLGSRRQLLADPPRSELAIQRIRADREV